MICKGVQTISLGFKTILKGFKMILKGSKIILSGVKTLAKRAALGSIGLWDDLICSYLWRLAAYGMYW